MLRLALLLLLVCQSAFAAMDTYNGQDAVYKANGVEVMRLTTGGAISASTIYVTGTTGTVSATYGYFKYISATTGLGGGAGVGVAGMSCGYRYVSCPSLTPSYSNSIPCAGTQITSSCAWNGDFYYPTGAVTCPSGYTGATMGGAAYITCYANAGVAGSPAGSTSEVQYNNGGSTFGSSSNFVYASGVVSVTGIVSATNISASTLSVRNVSVTTAIDIGWEKITGSVANGVVNSTATCSAGKRVLGGGCSGACSQYNTTLGTTLDYDPTGYPSSNTVFTCTCNVVGYGGTGTANALYAYAICGKVM